MRNRGQTKCKWCRKWYLECRISECLSDECKNELVDFANTHGRLWRSKLRTLWMNGSEVLRELRNTVGPTDLSGVKPPKQRYRRA